jgi:cytochrome b subunit of formate dehydrogenase
MRGLAGLLIALAATAATGLLVLNIVGQAGTSQPWSHELSDDFVFVRALPVLLGLGIVYGFVGGWLYPARPTARRPDGAVRRFSPATVLLHALITVGFLLALPTGVWQYLGGILDVAGPLPVYLYYRIHYIGAALIVAAVVAFLTYWWMTGDRTLLVARRDWARHLRGFAQELPPALGGRLAGLLKLDLRQPAGSSGPFTFYEKVFVFPSWGFAIALITVTGLVKLLRYAVPVPGPVVFVVSTLHVTAMVLLVILTLDHLRYTFARWPLMVAMATGWMPQRRTATPSARPERASSAAGSAGGDA